MLFSRKTPLLNRNSVFRYALFFIIVVVGALYALPNVYGDDYAIQITSAEGGRLPLDARREVVAILGDSAPYTLETTVEGGNETIFVRFATNDAQLTARAALQALPIGYNAALTLLPAVPGWMAALRAEPMYLGLDLRGGVYFLLEVDMDTARANVLVRRAEDIRVVLSDAEVAFNRVQVAESAAPEIIIQGGDNAAIRQALNDAFVDMTYNTSAGQLTAMLSDDALADLRRSAIGQNMVTLRNRINELGVAEPVVQRQGANYIVVQLPGVQDTARAKDILGATATLEYRLVAVGQDATRAAARGFAPVGTKLYYTRGGEPVLLRNSIIVTGESVTNAQSGIEHQTGTPMVSVSLDAAGGRRMLEATKRNVGRPMAVVFVETRVERTPIVENGVEVGVARKREKTERVISVANIREQFGSRFQTTGLDSPAEARDLALLLRAGSLAAPMEIVEERTIGPSMGADNVRQGFWSVAIGFLLVLLFMPVRYKVFGVFAGVALVLNLVLMIAALSLLQAVLTLPGIAGIVLTVGMSVDANVLIFERIREEIRGGKGVQQAIHAGYARAFTTIADANITTLLAAIVLFVFGTGPIKGFAITLSLGIVTSMMTAIWGTRLLVNAYYGGKDRTIRI